MDYSMNKITYRNLSSLRICLLAAVFAFGAAQQARAATITWGTATTISGDTDVSTVGTFLGAYSLNAGGGTINGVTFTSNSSGTLGSNFTFSTAGTGYNSFGGNANPYNGLSTAYKTLLTNDRYGIKTATVTINNLTIGRQYSVQIWANDSRGTGGGLRLAHL
jgi:hypothetical protein